MLGYADPPPQVDFDPVRPPPLPSLRKRDIFVSFFDLHERCPACGIKFERARLLGRVDDHHHDVRSPCSSSSSSDDHPWPDVPWNWLLGVTIGANLICRCSLPGGPVGGMEMSWHPLEPAEIEAANRHVAARSR